MAFNKKFLLATTLIAGFAVMAPQLAMAQQQPSSQQQEEDDEDTTEVETVTVTGSRIRRDDFTSSAPVQVITSEQAALEGLVDTAELLQQSSVASGSFQINNQVTGFVAVGTQEITAGANYVSLRGLGANRTLVLLNGRRLGPAGVSGAVGPVDLSVIPQSMIERVEILTDGASSVYGSDAVAGVVNIITRSNLDGITLQAYGNRPFEDGGETFRLNGAWGRTFDRGYITAAADWYQFEGTVRSDRDFTQCTADYLFDPNTGARNDRIDRNTGEPLCLNIGGSGHSVINLANGERYAYRNTSLYTYPTLAQGNYVNPILGAGADTIFARLDRAGYPQTWGYGTKTHPFADGSTALTPSRRYSVSLIGAYDITPNIEAYGEFLWNRRLSSSQSFSNFAPSIANAIGQTTTGLSNLNPNNRNPVTGLPFPGAVVSPIIPRAITSDQSVDYYRVMGGLRGDFGSNLGWFSNWGWDLYGQYSRSDGTYGNSVMYTDRISAISGAAPCAVSAFGNLSGFNCADLPGGLAWTSQRVVEGNLTAQEIAFLFGRAEGTTIYEQATIEGSVAGDLFELPAGPVGVALGFQVRRDEIDDQPDPQAVARNLYNFTSALPTAGEDTVREVFGEIEVPLVAGVAFVDSLTLNASARYSDYDSYGDNTTYKVAMNWQVTPAWRLRATHGTSFRAPSLFEQFLGGRLGFQGQGIDICLNPETIQDPVLQANCRTGRDINGDGDFTDAGELQPVPDGYAGLNQLSASVFLAGGAAVGLSAETSEATTFGVIWTPSFIDLNVAVNYFEISVEDEVRRFGSGNIISECYTSPNFPNDPFCDLLERNAAGSPRIVTVFDAFTNVASQVNRGIDLSARYSHEFSFGDLTLDGQFTWQLEDQTQISSTVAPEDFNGSVTEPHFTGNMGIRFDRGDWTVAWNVDMLGKASDTDLLGADTFLSTTASDIPNGYYYINPANNLPSCTGGVVPPPTSTATCSQLIYRKQYTEFTAYHDFSVRYEMDNYTFTVGVQNVFDEEPPALSNYTGLRIGTAGIGGYDLLGRRAFFDVTARF